MPIAHFLHAIESLCESQLTRPFVSCDLTYCACLSYYGLCYECIVVHCGMWLASSPCHTCCVPELSFNQSFQLSSSAQWHACRAGEGVLVHCQMGMSRYPAWHLQLLRARRTP